jgi:uncharacterized protein (DUF58 family)
LRVREYLPGDDVRSIDWNVTAKTGHPFVKVFEEERELTIILAVDLSASGDFGSGAQSKRDLAAELACVLAFSATRNNDKVGLLLYTDRVEKLIPPKKGRRHILRVIREMLFFEPTGRQTDTVQALQFLNRLVRKRAVVFVLSDFLQEVQGGVVGDPDGPEHPLYRSLSFTNQRHDVVCIHIEDPREKEIPNLGLITLEDAETGDLIELDTRNLSNRVAYRRHNQVRVEHLMKGLRQAGIDTVSISTGQPYIAALRALFERSSHRL